MLRQMDKSVCGQCGKQFTNKKGVNQHMQRMHNNKKSAKTVYATLEENVIQPSTPPMNKRQSLASQTKDVVVIAPVVEIKEILAQPRPKKMKNSESNIKEKDQHETSSKEKNYIFVMNLVIELTEYAVDIAIEKADVEMLLAEN